MTDKDTGFSAVRFIFIVVTLLDPTNVSYYKNAIQCKYYENVMHAVNTCLNGQDN